MLTKREKMYFAGIVAVIVISSLFLGVFDDILGGFTALGVAEILRYMRQTPPVKQDEEYER